MDDLSNSIFTEYLKGLDKLPFEKQFHFVSRLYLWNQDPHAKTLLDNYKDAFTAGGDPKRALEDITRQSQLTAAHGSKNAAELRMPYFQKYPRLKPTVSLLFRITFLKHIYDIDCRELLYEFVSKQEIEQLRQDLLADPTALAILSTHAINFLYLYERVMKEHEDLDISSFFTVAKEYDLTNKLHLQLYIYLYTHCIIGDSMFYYRAIPKKILPEYQRMIRDLETLVTEHYDDINLDNKFEFLVCAKIAQQPTKLTDKIFDEASRSVADSGTFLIDRHNNNPQTNNIDLAGSEHRNVLFIMANRDFTPFGQ